MCRIYDDRQPIWYANLINLAFVHVYIHVLMNVEMKDKALDVLHYAN